MASRQEIHRSKISLKNDLREQYRNGVLVPGAPAPSLRDMAEQYGISTPTVTQALQELVEEGLLHTIPRVGTFVGPRKSSLENYLFLDDEQSAFPQRTSQFRMGFEDRIAQLGGASIKMSPARLEAALQARDLPPLAGVIELVRQDEAFWRNGMFGDNLARVRFSSQINNDSPCDSVSFDDMNGGRQATQHLLGLGHHRIAFLGLHSTQRHDTRLDWSLAREEGWRQAMTQAHLSHEDLGFDPHEEPTNDLANSEVAAVREIARDLVLRSDITAVVAANDHAALGLIRELSEARVASNRWPSIVGFDDDPSSTGHLVTSLRLPWEKLGRAAADMLWERRNNRLPKTPQHTQVPMSLITRMTCRKDWSTSAGDTIVAAVAS